MSDNGVPAHVQPDRVYDFDFLSAPEFLYEPHRRLRKLHREAPEIFWTPRNGGHWIVARAAPALEMLRRHEDFSAAPVFNKAKDRWPRTIPNQYDPPDHADFRRILNPWFSPAAIQRREPQIRALAASLIDEILADGRCEFVEDIAKRFSVTIFMQIVDAPPQDRELLVELAERYTHSPRQEDRESGLADMAKYITGLLEDRRANPGDDLVSYILQAQFQGRPLDQEELLGMTTLVFLGGLDTVTGMLSFVMAYLARNPEQYARLVADRSFIATAAEELMRVHGVAGMERGATGSFLFRDVQFERGDRIVFLPQMFGMDDQQIDDPERVDLDREISMHMIFGAGPHRCLGSHLARQELRIFLEEWAARVPSFHATDGPTAPCQGGIVWTPVTVPLAWEPIH